MLSFIKTKKVAYKSPLFICQKFIMVPPARIELAIDPYHGSVIPLN